MGQYSNHTGLHHGHPGIFPSLHLTDVTDYTLPEQNQAGVMAMRRVTNIAPKLTAGIRTASGSYMQIPMLVDTGADISILGSQAMGKLDQAEMRPLLTPMKVNGIGGNTRSLATWKG